MLVEVLCGRKVRGIWVVLMMFSISMVMSSMLIVIGWVRVKLERF